MILRFQYLIITLLTWKKAKFREPILKFKPQVKESKHEQHDSNRCHHRNTWKSTLSLCALPLATNRALNLLLLTPGKPYFLLYNHLHSIALIHFVYFTSILLWFFWTISSCIAPKNWEHCFPSLLNSDGGRFMMIAWQSKSKPIFKTKPNRWLSIFSPLNTKDVPYCISLVTSFFHHGIVSLFTTSLLAPATEYSTQPPLSLHAPIASLRKRLSFSPWVYARISHQWKGGANIPCFWLPNSLPFW